MATFPSNTKVAGVSTGLTADLDTTYGLLQSILGPVVLPSGDTSGADDTGLITGVISAGDCPVLTRGTYYVTANQVILDAAEQQTLDGAGDQSTLIKLVGATAGAAVTVKNSAGSYNGQTQRAALRNFAVNGASSATGSTGVEAGDSARLVLENISSNSFAGGKCFYFYNQEYWTEQITGVIRAYGAPNLVVFDDTSPGTDSFDRPELAIYLAATDGQTGLEFLHGAIIQGGRLGIYGNFSSAGSTSYVLNLASANAQLLNCNIDLDVENDSATYAPQTINFSAASNSFVDCWGGMNFDHGGSNAAFTGSNLAASGATFRFSGPIQGDSSLVSTSYSGVRFPASALASSGTIFTNVGGTVGVNPAGNVTGIILATGQRSGQQIRVVNRSAYSVTFAASGTSNVADGTSDVIATLTAATYTWVAADSLWYRG